MIRKTAIVLIAIGFALSTRAGAQEFASSDSASEPAPGAETTQTSFSFSPSLGITVGSISGNGEESFTAQWQAEVQSRLVVEGTVFQLSSSIYAKYGQLHSADATPVKSADDLILSLTPSATVVPSLGLRLFLEVTGETQFARGVIDDSETGFLDPLFLYQSLFLGKRFAWASDDDAHSFDLTTGVGYALQQTVAEKFVLEQNRQFVITNNIPLSSVQDQVTLESGYSAILDVNYRGELATDLGVRANFKTVALPGSDFTENPRNGRVTSLLLLGLQYKFFSLDYSCHLVYDSSISPRRQLNQSFVFGLRAEL